MPKKGSSKDHNFSFAFSPRKAKPRPKLFQPDKRTLHTILVDSVRDYKFRKDEIFKRMKVTTYVQLIVQVADFDSQSSNYPANGFGEPSTPYRPDTADREVYDIQTERGGGDANGTAASPDPESSRSRLQEVVRGVGEADLNGEGGGINAKLLVNSPYLLLDIREKDAYDECHIITAKNYPTAMLARSVNYETKEMLQYKNQDGKIIILYDNDETLAHRAATTLVQRGYDNLFILSGGLKVAARTFPEGLITGTLPAAFLHQHPGGGGKEKLRYQTTTVHQPATKSEFTSEDLNCLAMYMDGALSDHSSCSRLSQRSKGSAGRTTAMSSTSTSTTGLGRQPFRP